METRTSARECWLVYLLGTLVSFLMMRYGHVACSASMHLRSDYDLNIYYLIGNAWMNGILPYVGLTDLKGPLVFLFHGLGSLVTPGSFLGICLLHAPLVGLGLLFAYKSARLFLPAGSSGAVLGFYLVFLMYFAVNPAEQVWVMQHISLYFLLCWASGKSRCFSDCQLLLLGAFVAVALLLKFNLVAFWGPVCLLALCVARWRAFLYQGIGFVVVLLPCLGYFWWHGALQAMWDEYVGIALSYGRVPFAESAIHERHFLLFRGATPYHFYKAVPEEVLAILGAVPCLAWPLLWLRRITSLRMSALCCLAAAFILQVYASYSGKYDFLHYAFVFFPFCFLSLVLLACVLRKWQKLFAGFGYVAGCGILAITLLLPVYVKYGRTYNGNAQMKETALLLCQRLEGVPASDLLILDTSKSLHINRLTGRLPHLHHFVPPLIKGGFAQHRAEQLEYIQEVRPTYLLGSEWDKEREAELIEHSGVKYRAISHRELGFPAYPAHARQPELILYQRID